MTNPTYKNMESQVLQVTENRFASQYIHGFFSHYFLEKSPQIFLYGLYTWRKLENGIINLLWLQKKKKKFCSPNNWWKVWQITHKIVCYSCLAAFCCRKVGLNCNYEQGRLKLWVFEVRKLILTSTNSLWEHNITFATNFTKTLLDN